MLLSAGLLCPSLARAEPSQAQREDAARQFDVGVYLFDKAEYSAAVQAFLKADDLSPSSDAIANAIAAARRSNDHLLVVQAAERGIARAAADPALAEKARLALAESAPHLSRLTLDCDPKPCEVLFDGATVDTRSHYVLPGTHRMNATGAEQSHAEEVQTLIPGTTYRIVLHPHVEGQPQSPTEVLAEPHPSSFPAPNSNSSTTPAEQHGDATADTVSSERKGLSPVWFYVGAGVTGVLAGATIWSGIDTVVFRGKLGDRAPASDIDQLKSKRLRTDILLTGSVIAGAATGYLGLFVVDWKGSHTETALLPVPGGTLLTARGRF